VVVKTVSQSNADRSKRLGSDSVGVRVGVGVKIPLAVRVGVKPGRVGVGVGWGVADGIVVDVWVAGVGGVSVGSQVISARGANVTEAVAETPGDGVSPGGRV
jgi:hypothetical protein